MDEHRARRALRDPSQADRAGTAATPCGETARSRAEAEATKDDAPEASREGGAHVEGACSRRRGRHTVERRAARRADEHEGGAKNCSTPRADPRWKSLIASTATAAGSAPAASSCAAAVRAVTTGGFTGACASPAAFGTAAATPAAAQYDDVDTYHNLDHHEHYEHDDVDHDDDHASADDDRRDDDHDHPTAKGRLTAARGRRP
jgi:hypothetical protein